MKIKLSVRPGSLMPCPYGNNYGLHDPSDDEIKAAYEKGAFDHRVMDDPAVQSAIHNEAMTASNNGQDREAYCKVWTTYHAKRTAYWMNEMKLKPDSWQKNEDHPMTVKLLATSGNHRARAAILMNLPSIEVIIQGEPEIVQN